MPDSAKIHVLVVDDHDELRGAILTLLADERDIEIVGEAKNGVEAIEQSRVLSPDVVLMDIRMPELDGIEATAVIMRGPFPPRVLILTQYEDKGYVRLASDVGARGYLIKSSLTHRLADAIRAVFRGEEFLAASPV